MLLSDLCLRERMNLPDHSDRRLRIFPEADPTPVEGMIVGGLTSYGYDVSTANSYLIVKRPAGVPDDDLPVIDPKTFRSMIGELIRTGAATWHVGESCVIPPNGFALCPSLECFRIPSDCSGSLICKSTYARCGILLGTTPMEPGWAGRITIEISNSLPLPARIWSGQAIGQIQFHSGRRCGRDYAEKKGKYQDQDGVTLPVVL